MPITGYGQSIRSTAYSSAKRCRYRAGCQKAACGAAISFDTIRNVHADYMHPEKTSVRRMRLYLGGSLTRRLSTPLHQILHVERSHTVDSNLQHRRIGPDLLFHREQFLRIPVGPHEPGRHKLGKYWSHCPPETHRPCRKPVSGPASQTAICAESDGSSHIGSLQMAVSPSEARCASERRYLASIRDPTIWKR